jgi:RNA polymerase sigma-70 factor (ECF subfamily)
MTTPEYNLCVREQADSLYRFVCKSLGNMEEAKDIVQQAFLVLWEQKKKVPKAKAKSFLFTVAYRRSMDWHRQKRPENGYLMATENRFTENKPPPDLKNILQRALSLLGYQARNLVLLKDYEGYSYEEIAELTALTPVQVKVYLHRARKTLRNYLVNTENLI